ncbi:MAG: glycosyltransferase family 4 protein [Syntrophales bacterium]|nr:glycosyltransferase family 4 protein [Syntrophales bacterium]MDD5531151.1 glycosyltransferase family 4 protein [Syntrophales bacterium]
MKVLLVGAYPPPYGGLQVHLAGLQNYLERKGHSCFVVNLGKNKKLRSSKVTSPTTSIGVARHLWKRRDHVCHLHFGGNLHARILLLALFAGVIFPGGCATTIHSGGLPVWGIPADPLRRMLMRMSFSRSRAIICVNRRIAGFFGDLGIRRDRIHVVSPFAAPDGAGRRQLAPFLELFMKKKTRILCSIGLLEEEYDIPLLLSAFRRYAAFNPGAGLVVIGSGSLRSMIEDRIITAGLSGKVLLTGDLDHAQTLGVLSSSDCYIRASRYDGDCISLREAIHFGIHSIATDTGLRPEGAVLFQPGNEDELLERMLAIPDSPGIRRIGSDGDNPHFGRIESILSNFPHVETPQAPHNEAL